MQKPSNRNILLQTTPIAIIALMLLLPMVITPVSAGLPSKSNLKIGILLPTTGTLSSLGIDEVHGADLAIRHANSILNAGSTGVNFTDTGLILNSGTDPSVADAAFKQLVDTLHVDAVVGAAGSGETSGFLADANLRQVPAISPSSTSPKLALSGDYLFRTPGPDTVQGVGDAIWLWNHGVRYVAGLTRDDSYGTGILAVFAASFIALGGTVEGWPCPSNDPAQCPTTYSTAGDINTAAVTAAGTLNTQVGTALTAAGGNATKVGVYIIAFEEAQAVYDYAYGLGSSSNLWKVNWYGTDGTLDPYFLPTTTPGCGTVCHGDANSASFLVHVNQTGTNPIADSPGSNQAVADNIFINGSVAAGTGFNALYGAPTTPYAAYAYDASILLMLAILAGNSYAGTSIADWLGLNNAHDIGNSTIGSTGLLSLAPTGDRAHQDYIIWHFLYNSTSHSYYEEQTNGPFYNGVSKTYVSSLPVGNEAGGTLWTTQLANLAAAVTVSASVTFANAYAALSILLFTASAVMIVQRRRRI